MRADVEARLAALQADMQQTQQALTALEQERQGLLQRLIGQQYAAQVLQGLLTERAEWSPPTNPDHPTPAWSVSE